VILGSYSSQVGSYSDHITPNLHGGAGVAPGWVSPATAFGKAGFCFTSCVTLPCSSCRRESPRTATAARVCARGGGVPPDTVSPVTSHKSLVTRAVLLNRELPSPGPLHCPSPASASPPRPLSSPCLYPRPVFFLLCHAPVPAPDVPCASRMDPLRSPAAPTESAIIHWALTVQCSPHPLTVLHTPLGSAPTPPLQCSYSSPQYPYTLSGHRQPH